MDFLKKHYEKILLTVALLGSVGLLVAMPFFIQADQKDADEHKNVFFHGKVAPLPDLDMGLQNQLSQRLNGSFNLDLETTNKLFNPLEWQKTLDGRLIKRENIGSKALTIVKINPLYLILKLDKVETNEPVARYLIGVQHQASTKPALQKPQHRGVSPGEKANDTFQLLSVTGAPENPDQLILKLVDSNETITLTPDKPYQRVDGYSVDLRYDPERKSFPARRVGASITFAGEEYNIVAISEDEVILSAQSNQKRTKLRYAPTP